MGSDEIQKNSPGQMLRTKREAMQIPIDSIANRLGLSIAVIDAIEQDAYKKLPTTVYIKGYLKAYAKIVALDEQHIIQLFNNTRAAALAPEVLPKIKQCDQLDSNRKTKIAHYLTLLGLLILMLLWYQGHYTVSTTTSKPAFDYEFRIVEHPPNNQNIDMPANTVADTTVSASSDAITLISSGVTTPTSSAHQNQIKLILSADSWIEITDVYQQRLFFDLGQAGTEITLSGAAPFTILLGNAAAVQLFYNNEPISLKSNTKDNVARIIVGE